MQTMREYSSAIQLRSDRWSALREATAALTRNPSAGEAAQLRSTAEALFDSLSTMEAYWAFPGKLAFSLIRRHFEQGKLDDVSFAVNRIKRALTTGAYRRRSIPLERDSVDQDEQDDEAHHSPEMRALSKPYFEVLIVDSVSEQQERWLKANVTGMRRQEDQFIYEAVVVPSIEDALIAVLFNHNIQAIVVRPGLVLHSDRVEEILTQYLARAEAAKRFPPSSPKTTDQNCAG